MKSCVSEIGMMRVGISGGENIFSSPGVYAWGSGDRNNLSLLQESVGKISLCTSPCLRGASFLKQFQHGDTEITEPTQRNSIFPTDCFRSLSEKSRRDAMFIERV